MKKCPFCAEDIQDEAIVCRFCGKEILGKEKISKKQKKKAGVAGIVALAAAGLGLFMPVILMMLLAPVAFIFSSIELKKGSRILGTIALLLSLLELGVIVSTFQSCSKFLSSIGTYESSPSKPYINWKENLKITYNDIDVSSNYETYTFEVKNIGTKTIKDAKFTLYIKDNNDNILLTKENHFIYGWDEPMKPNQVRKFDIMAERLKSVKTSDTFSYSITIVDYE